MDVPLTPELEEFVLSRLQTGRYDSASDVVREALLLLEEREASRMAEIQEFRTELDDRLGSLDRGEGIDGEVVFARLRQRSQERRKQHA